MLLEIAGIPKTKLCQFESVPASGMPSQAGKPEQGSQAGAKAPISPAWVDIVDQARLEHLIRERQEITSLYNLGLALNAGLNLSQMIQTLYKETGRLLDTTNFAVALYDSDGDTLDFVLVCVQGRRVKPFSVKLVPDHSLTGRVLTTQTPLLIRDLAETGQTDETGPLHPGQPIRSWLGAPLFHPALTREKAQGALVTWRYEPEALTEHDLWLLSAIGAQAALAIRHARLVETSQRRLTELAVENARWRERALEAEAQARRTLARELHDGPTQQISAIDLGLQHCQQLLERDPARLAREFTALQALVRETMQAMRTLLFELRPLALEIEGLAAALQTFLERRQKDIETTRLTLKVKSTQPDGAISRQAGPVEAALFAIAREAVNNALKHAQAGHIVVELKETPTALYLTIGDDGVGFDVAEVLRHYAQRHSLGLVNLQEQAELIGGELALESVPGCGTRLGVYVPKACSTGQNL